METEENRICSNNMRRIWKRLYGGSVMGCWSEQLSLGGGQLNMNTDEYSDTFTCN